MTVRIYRSDDASAPVLNGTAGSLITVLDACLVNGYGSKVAAGWTKPYSGTNLAAYRMSTAGNSSGCYLRVDDTSASDARVVGYETMSDINTGTVRFPTELQQSGGFWFKKSNTVNSTARPWIVIADNRFVYVFSFVTSTSLISSSTSSDGVLLFGDLKSYKPVDLYAGYIFASTLQNNPSSLPALSATFSASDMFLQRDYLGFSPSLEVCKSRRGTYLTGSSHNLGQARSGAFPDPVTGKLNIFAIDVHESSNVIRGTIPGLYDPYGGTNVGSILDTFFGDSSLGSVEFILLPCYISTTVYRAAIQISGDWYQ